MKQLFILLITLCALPPRAAARELTLTLDEAITRARARSVDAAVALDELKTAYWQWRTFRADHLPEVTFEATAPSYSNQYTSYMDDRGDYSFVNTNHLEATGQLSVIQKVRLTGATVRLTSSLDFMRMFGDNSSTRFMTIPVALSINQPLFAANTMKWDARIEPVRYAEAKAAFMSATEDVARATVEYYFSLILSRTNLSIAEQNLAVAEKLYEVAVEKRKMGQISENDLLQMELNVLDARSDATDCRSTLKSNMFTLRSFLDIEEDVDIIPVVPDDTPVADISYGDALDRALANNKFAQSMRRRQLEADYEVARAKGDRNRVDLFVQVGFTGTDSRFGDSYTRLRGNQLAQVGFSIPLLDWGRRAGKVKVAESNRRVTESRLRKESQDFSHDLFVLVERYTNQQQQLEMARRSSEIASRRYDTNVQTYLIGRISTLDLNDSQTRKDDAMRNYINELYRFWTYWYQIRSLTLYDYSGHMPINADISRLLEQ